jgi:magnesium-transporting ATPase (P-type)
MSEAEIVERHSKPYTDQIATVGFLVALASYVVYIAKPLSVLRAPLAFLLCPVLIYSVVLAAALYRKGTNDLPLLPFVVGSVFVVGGVALDGVATLMMTPTLRYEANSVARALLDTGLPVSFVVICGIVSEVLFISLVCILWAAFLRHRKALIASAWSRNPTSVSDFIEAAVGVGHLSCRQLLLPRKTSELPLSYHFVWFIAAGLVGSCSFRWYMGLSWLGWISWPCAIVLIVSVVLPMAAYFLWLGLEYLKHPTADAVAQG